ncbi:MAG: HAMP domain-containing sensor histidine kinase [Anaeromyxobacter sp.]
MARPRALPLRTRVLVLVAVTALVPVALLGLVLSGAVPVASGRALAAVLVLHLGFAAALAWGAARSVTAPLERLGADAERIARGELGAPVADVGLDEVGRLGRALERMRAGLEDHVRLVAENAALVARETARAGRVREVLEAQEGERRRVARELHDETSQSLAALAIGIDRAAEAVREGRDPALGEVKGLALRTLDEVERIVRDLRPGALDDLGFASAVQAVADRELALRGVQVRCELDEGVEGRLPREAETAVFRMLQEAIGNAARHARASQVLVQVEARDGALVASVEDDGQGFDPAAPRDPGRRGGFGLVGLRERAELLGGAVRIESAPGQGTRVEITVPLPGAGPRPVAGERT